MCFTVVVVKLMIKHKIKLCFFLTFRRGNPVTCAMARQDRPLPTLPTVTPPITRPPTIVPPTTVTQRRNRVTSTAATMTTTSNGRVGMLQHAWGTAVAIVMAYWLGS